MLKKVVPFLLFVIICGGTFLSLQHLKEYYFKKSIIKEMNSKRGLKYEFSGNIKRCGNNTNIPSDLRDLQNCYKLVYEMNFDCSICIEELKEIYSFYLQLSRIREIAFCLITTEKSYGYIKYYLDQSLKNYDLWLIQQEFRDDNIKLYLLDNLNNIVMAGDIRKYPFLKDEYLRKLEIKGDKLRKGVKVLEKS